MVVRIRLARWGASKNPFYGIVIAQNRAARDGKHMERVGTYNPIPDPQGVKRIELNVDRIKYWLGVGAQPSDRVAWLLAKINLVPLTPHQLQNQGLVSLNDRKTWDVEVQDSAGNKLAHLSAAEAREVLSGSPLADKLPADIVRSEPPNTRVVRANIKLDGTPPKAPLTDAERLLVLKEFTGI
ncbi:hypothetical protein PhCBS80983_g01323 [Powellomyces hirtus]|uniref:Ribosomal protein S16 n=1 Tax=Powellomyces hirtus TaxID=109895 RepID=A0A507EB61_9FUNG|nr:hypothetical protein PhCBS80983_g01323 [Powellomyces hirtus]